jgi:hypothetical protein
MRIKGTDEENTTFGPPTRVADQKPGFSGEVAKQEVETRHDRRLRPRDRKDIPQEGLAYRIAKSLKEE